MNGFAFSTQTRPAVCIKEDITQHSHSQRILIKKGIVLWVGLLMTSCPTEATNYKLSYSMPSQIPAYPLSALNLCKEFTVRKNTEHTLSRLEELMQLPDNWDGNGALPIEQAAYRNTRCAILLIGEKTSDTWKLFPNTNGTLLLTAPGNKSASISIGNEQFSYFAMKKGTPTLKGTETFSAEKLSRVFDQIQAVINRD